MKKKFFMLVTAAAFCILLCGCSVWADGSYISIQPHEEQNLRPEKDIIEVYSYIDLQNALVELVESGSEEAIVSVSRLNQDSMEFYMNAATNYVKEKNAIGAYAVDSITYELGTNAGRAAMALKISYNRNPTSILRMKRATDMEKANQIIWDALDGCEANTVFYVENFRNSDFTQLVQDYANDHPDRIMETPLVTYSVYPEIGVSRVVELNFTYQTSREDLRMMQDLVRPVFIAAEMYVRGSAENAEKFAQLYSFLMERYNYTIGTSITPSYHLIRHGVGDSKAFAIVYTAMCREAGLECQTVSGTRDGESWYWNMIVVDGVYYHVDLLRCNEMEGFAMNTDSQMEGYVWDYTAYIKT